MKVMTIFGTRPEIIRLSQIIPRLDRLCSHVLVHTGQNYDPQLSDVFFEELGIRAPDRHLGVHASQAVPQIADILVRADEALAADRPDRVVILGDTNSGLAALVAARRGTPVFHLEAGNRCFDDRVPEEINRRVIDHSSSVLMPYTHRSKENLLREGIERDRIFVTGNPILEVLRAHEDRISASDALGRYGLSEGQYFLATLHRAENVDAPARLRGLIAGLESVASRHGLPVVVSVHPRTADRLRQEGLKPTGLTLLAPLGFFEFVKLERGARVVLSDSGTVQEECAIFRVPNVTLRDVTERPETIECGSNILSGGDPDDILRAVTVAQALEARWVPPAEYTVTDVSAAVTKIVLGFTSWRRHGAGC
ncbi:MAG: non-hydrolyzing UDP-N-acetylglucosamine 2-epimerase [Vicinamibacterales bacterium]